MSVLPSAGKLLAGNRQATVDDVFQTALYTGTGASVAISNDLQNQRKGGLVWIKNRDDTSQHQLFDTLRGAGPYLKSNSPDAQLGGVGSRLTSFTNMGFTLDGGPTPADYNAFGNRYASWNFRRGVRFFDIVSWVGDGIPGRQIPHSLAIRPGLVLVKATSASASWAVWHNSFGANEVMVLNQNVAKTSSPTFSVFAATAADITINAGLNANGVGYVAYFFADDSAGKSMIKCGSYVGNDGDAIARRVVTGWQPQFLLIKGITTTGDWALLDTKRQQSGDGVTLMRANATTLEQVGNPVNTYSTVITADGFTFGGGASAVNGRNQSYLYMAIRKGRL